MSDILIRKATVHDLAVLREFEQGIISAERPFDPTLKDDPVTYYDLPRMLGDSQTDVVVASVGERVVACGYSRIEVSKLYLKHRQHAYFGMMYVRPVYRGQGLNALVMEELKKLAKERGITELRLEVYAGNQAAINAYEKFGFAGYILEMRMSLE
jgi:ribosomal protein S18 acetylase RimI-like enzyme